MMKNLWLPLVLAAFVAGCRENKPMRIPPTIGIDALGVDFGAVRVDGEGVQVLLVNAVNGADIALESVTLSGPSTFSLDAPPTVVPGLGTETLTLRYKPTAAGVETTELIIKSDDELRPEVRIPVTGKGAHPALTLELACDTATKCEAMVQQSPLSVRFADEPFVRLRMLEASELPKLVMRNDGEVPVVVTSLALGGTDAPAFSFVGNAAIPDGGLVLGLGRQQQVPLRFRPTSDSQQQWSGTLRVDSDSNAAPSVTIPLAGSLRPNLPPTVCLNVARVSPQGLPPRDFDTTAGWAEAIAATDAGVVDLSSIRDIPPRGDVQLSALSSMDETTCTTDPEDGRLGLTWAWTLTAQPGGSTPATLLNASTPRANFRPVATGSYTAQLTVTDSQGNSTSQSITFAVAVKNDLVVQLDWAGSAAVDLDVHLVRPGATPFAAWASTGGPNVSGDLNGYAATTRADGGVFDWGMTGFAGDDPRLNFDDTGAGPLVENISLNLPENDPACASAGCLYSISVHGFRDGRDAGAAVPCTVDGGAGCLDGEACDCPGGAVCVANAAMAGAAATGGGRCLPTVPATLRVYLRGSSVAALSTPVVLGAPCQMVQAATVLWPALGSDAGVVVNAATGVKRFGVRGNGSLQCAPDGPQAGVPWYREHPR